MLKLLTFIKAIIFIKKYVKVDGVLQEENTDYELLANISTTNNRLLFMERLAGLGYWELDITHRKIYCSDEVYRILGADLEQRNSLNIRDFISAQEYQQLFRQLKHLYRFKIKFSQEIAFLRQDGSKKYCQLRADFFYIRHYAVIAGTIQDLSNLIETKKQLVEARNHAEKLNKDKSYFLAQASHDLRQPMQALALYLDLFPTDGLTAAQCKLWQKINFSAENLKSLLNNVLDLSKLDYGGTKVSKSLFNVGMLLSDLGREFRDIAECKNLTLEYSICNCQVFSDAFLVERVLRNLLSNAFKFAFHKVKIICTEFEDKVQIDVSDDGRGISFEDQKHIFEEFYRGKNSSEHMADGAGLGLAIVQKILKLLHTEIKLQSAPGKGSVFSFFLPKGC